MLATRRQTRSEVTDEDDAVCESVSLVGVNELLFGICVRERPFWALDVNKLCYVSVGEMV